MCLIDIADELGRSCGSSAWNWANWASHHWMLALWPPRAQDEVWNADRDALIASSMVFPAGRAVRAPGGYRLSGRWPFSSGVDGAGWNMLGGRVQDAGGEYRMFLLPATDYRVHDTWHVMGLCGTGSKDIEASEVFVPEHRTLAVADAPGGSGHPGAQANPAPLFRVTLFGAFAYVLSGVPLGIAQGAYERVVVNLREQAARYSGRGLSTMNSVQMKVAEAGVCIDTARLVMRNDCLAAQAWADRDAIPDVLTKATWRRNGAFAANLCERAVDLLFKTGGGGALFDTHPLQRAFRDVHAATAHLSMIWEAQAATFGAVALGLPSDNPTL